MSKLISLIRGEWKTEHYLTRDFVFLKNPHCMYSFKVDDNKVIFDFPTQEEIFNDCLALRGSFEDLGIVEHEKRYKDPDIAECSCGETFILRPEYLDACECPGCGQWYSIGGYPLLPPEEWGTGGVY